MKKLYLCFVVIYMFVGVSISFSQTEQKPKLVVGIVVDQMRYDFLHRFMPFYGKGGFKRLIEEGSNFTYAHLNYEATKTAPGHASIYTGTTPFYNGIISNDWYDKKSKKSVNAVVDPNYKSIGSNGVDDPASPNKLFSTTITDQLKLSNNNNSKVISISFKNRGAVLPGGHFPNGAFWYGTKTGNFVTSSYYMNELPKWVEDFNKRKLSDKYLENGWHLSQPVKNYSISAPDESENEADVFKEGKTSFPHLFNNVKPEDRYSVLANTPHANDLVALLVKEALIHEKLGKGNYTDFLAISFSATDYIGHSYGTNSFEIQDAYIKIDSLIADLLVTFDKNFGKGNYLLFLTSDHGALDTPGYLNKNNLPTGGLGTNDFSKSVQSFLSATFGNDKLIENISNKQIYFNREEIEKAGLDINLLQKKTRDYIRDNFPVILTIYTRDNFEGANATREPLNPTLNSFNPNVSGDILYSLKPGYLTNMLMQGTNHGSEYAYDTHVPIIFYGWRIPKQTINTPVYIVDIAATVADLLNIAAPSACIGIPLIKK